MILSFFNKSSVFSYLLALGLLGLAVYSHDFSRTQTDPFDAERKVALALLSGCMLSIDWVVKQRYWATKANYHLVFFALFVFALPLQQWYNWATLCFFFYWVGLNFLVGIDQSGGQIKKTFNAAFFIFLGGLFYPPGLLFFPLVWIILSFQGGLDLRTFVISLLPLAALFLLEVTFTFFFPQSRLLTGISFTQVAFELPWNSPLRTNIWWLFLLLLLFFSALRHYIDMSAKSAAYGVGIYALLATAIAGFVFVLFFQVQNQMAWLLPIMVVTTLSTRLLEEIKRAWVRELLFLLFFVLLLFGKYGLPL